MQPATGETGEATGVLLGVLADLAAFIANADDDALDPDAAVAALEAAMAELAAAPGTMRPRLSTLLADLADAEHVAGREDLAEAADSLADGIGRPGQPLEGGPLDGQAERVLHRAVVGLLAFLELLGDDDADPDLALKAMQSAAAGLHRLGVPARDRLLGTVALLAEAGEGRAGPRGLGDFLLGFADAFDLAGPPGRHEPGLPAVPEGRTLISRKLVVVSTPKGREQAARQERALREAGMYARWEVPDARQAARALLLLREAGTSRIGVRIVEG